MTCTQKVWIKWKTANQAVLLQIGSNDLCKKSNSVRDVARGIIELSMLLRYKYKVKQVIVCPILHCLPPKRPINYAVDVDWFNGRCDELNVYLDSYFKDDNMENVMFWSHQIVNHLPILMMGYTWTIRRVTWNIIVVYEQLLLLPGKTCSQLCRKVCCNGGLQYFKKKTKTKTKHKQTIKNILCHIVYIFNYCCPYVDSHFTKNSGFEIDMLYNLFTTKQLSNRYQELFWVWHIYSWACYFVVSPNVWVYSFVTLFDPASYLCMF